MPRPVSHHQVIRGFPLMSNSGNLDRWYLGLSYNQRENIEYPGSSYLTLSAQWHADKPSIGNGVAVVFVCRKGSEKWQWPIVVQLRGSVDRLANRIPGADQLTSERGTHLACSPLSCFWVGERPAWCQWGRPWGVSPGSHNCRLCFATFRELPPLPLGTRGGERRRGHREGTRGTQGSDPMVEFQSSNDGGQSALEKHLPLV